MVIRIASFKGEIPRIIPRLLPDGYAQTSHNAKLETGAIMPVREPSTIETLGADAQTIYLWNGDWIGWNTVVNAAPGPVAADRLYYTGDGAPKVKTSANVYDLKITPPAAAVTATASSAADPDTKVALVYSYTWVTSLGEESEPAPISDIVEWSPASGITVTLSGFSAVPSGRGVTTMRIYRSQGGTTGATDLYFIEERVAGTGNYTDYVDTTPIQEPIASIDYNSPPDTLTGLVAMPGGMMAAFSGKELYFSEPWRPHAWPEKYILTTEYDIVALGAFGSSLAVLTTGTPYVVSGNHPESMVMERLEVNLPCLSAQGVVDLGYSIAYPSPDGLVTVGSSGAQIVTKGLMTRDQWRTYLPATFIAGNINGRYIASYQYTDLESVEHKASFIIDLSGDTPFLTHVDFHAQAMFNDIETDALYYLVNDRNILEWDSPASVSGEYRWRSKRMVLPGHTCFGAILIEGSNKLSDVEYQAEEEAAEAAEVANQLLINTGATMGALSELPIGLVTFAGSLIVPVAMSEKQIEATIIADDVVRAVVNRINVPVRLPSGYLATDWEIELRGNIEIQAVSLADDPAGLASG
jgi:hypothetical protein